MTKKKKGKKKSENMPVIYDRSYMTGVGWVGRVGRGWSEVPPSWHLTRASESDQKWPQEQSDPVTARTRLNWSNAEGKGSRQRGETIKVAYRAPAAQACQRTLPFDIVNQ